MKKTCRKCEKKFIKWDTYREHMKGHGLNPYDELLQFHGESLEHKKTIAERSLENMRELSMEKHKSITHLLK